MWGPMGTPRQARGGDFTLEELRVDLRRWITSQLGQSVKAMFITLVNGLETRFSG